MYSGTVTEKNIVKHTKATKFRGDLACKMMPALFLSTTGFDMRHPASPAMPLTKEELEELIFSIEALNIPDQHVIRRDAGRSEIISLYAIPVKYKTNFYEFGFGFIGKDVSEQGGSVNMYVNCMASPSKYLEPYFEVPNDA